MPVAGPLAAGVGRDGIAFHSSSQTLHQVRYVGETKLEADVRPVVQVLQVIGDAAVDPSQLLQANTLSADAYSAGLSSAATFALAAGTLGSAPQ
jgi:hypothetical protein